MEVKITERRESAPYPDQVLGTVADTKFLAMLRYNDEVDCTYINDIDFDHPENLQDRFATFLEEDKFEDDCYEAVQKHLRENGIISDEEAHQRYEKLFE